MRIATSFFAENFCFILSMPALPCRMYMQISHQSACRHNTLDFAYRKIVCQRELRPPLETPERLPYAHSGQYKSRRTSLFLLGYSAAYFAYTGTVQRTLCLFSKYSPLHNIVPFRETGIFLHNGNQPARSPIWIVPTCFP